MSYNNNKKNVNRTEYPVLMLNDICFMNLVSC